MKTVRISNEAIADVNETIDFIRYYSEEMDRNSDFSEFELKDADSK